MFWFSHVLPVLMVLMPVLAVFISPMVQASVNQTVIENMPNRLLTTSNATALTKPASGLNIVASFYPIFEFVKQVGGDRVAVTSLIPVGVKPHDFGPTINKFRMQKVQI
jgi:zinc transport system substrate-binding protein